MSVWDGSDWESGIDWDGVIERNVRLLGPVVATLCVRRGAPSPRPHGERMVRLAEAKPRR